MKRAFCNRPFEHLEINPEGETYICHPGCMKTFIGNALKQDLKELWNTSKAQKIRQSILNETFEYCEDCALISNKKTHFTGEIKDPFFKEIIKQNKTKIPHPKIIKIGYDRTCNLSCNTCRDAIRNRPKYTQNAKKIQQNLISTGWLKKAEWLIASGHGEVFASPTITKLLNTLSPKEYPNLKIKIFTNGQLLTEEKWNSLECKDLIKWIRISIDAATKETYEKIKGGSNFEKLIQNIEFIKKLKENNKIEDLTLTFVVQQANYKEMPQFVKLCKKYKADRIQFMQVKKWNKFSDEEYDQAAIHQETHPEHEQFLKIIKSIPTKGVDFELLRKFTQPFCDKPFTHLEIKNNGNIYGCCSGLLPIPFGNILEQNINEAWNSDKAQEIRQTILDGTFEYCNKKYCPIIQNNRSHQKFITKKEAKKVMEPPKIINCAFDRTCNLYCESCRKEIYTPTQKEKENNQKIKEKILSELTPTAKQIIISGSGDPFASPTFKDILKKIDLKKNPELKLVLFTNANLFTKENWEEIKHLKGHINSVRISIDAATKETYKKLRRNGNFEKLLKNLKFISKLREEKAIGNLTLTFVVQQANYKEMPQFVALGKKIECDTVLFSAIRNWGTYNEEEFKEKAIHQKTHPKHQELIKILNSLEIDKPKVYFEVLKKLRK